MATLGTAVDPLEEAEEVEEEVMEPAGAGGGQLRALVVFALLVDGRDGDEADVDGDAVHEVEELLLATFFGAC